ncbi:hypothetical protein DL96DRAFT_1711387 [Flagelloscypha sp. PMI_526]|nr:hypothetical protein DL96DRAFT_1711387 [Flagelloscypha sp. PMI_526]
MALPPPPTILENFFIPLTLYDVVRESGHRDVEAILPAPKRNIFSGCLKRFRAGSREPKLQVSSIDRTESKLKKFETCTVALKSLQWLESCARNATARSVMWPRETMLNIHSRSEGYRLSLQETSAENASAEEVKSLLIRASTAAQTILLLPELPLPSLPHELMRCIFLWVSCEDVREAKKLSLVSHTVQDWVDPCIFKFLVHTVGIENAASFRMLRAKKQYFVGCTLLLNSPGRAELGIVRVFQELPVLRSISCSGSLVSHIRTTTIASFFRFHIEDWTPYNSPLSSNIFSTMTHLSLCLRTLSVSTFSEWDWMPLKHLGGLRYFFLHTHTFPERGFYPNDTHASLWIDFMMHTVIPRLPPPLELMVWVVPDIMIHHSLMHYKILFDGTADRRLVLAFEKGDGLNAHSTSESAGAGHYALVYPALNRQLTAGLDWLEWLWLEALTFLKCRELVVD